MSHEASFFYEIAQQRRQALYLERVSANTEKFYRRYMAQFEQMVDRGYRDYIPAEMEQLERDLAYVRSHLVSAPEDARETSREIGSYIHSYWDMAKAAREQFERSLRMRREQAREARHKAVSEAMGVYLAAVSSIDAVVAGLAADDLDTIKQEIQRGELADAGKITERVSDAVDEGERKAAEWKQQQMERSSSHAIEKQIEEQREELSQENFGSQEKRATLLQALDNLKRSAADGTVDVAAATADLQRISQDADEQAAVETVRREAVKAVIKSLKKLDFTVSKPRLKDGEVILCARRPSGNRAMFRLSQGKLHYRLDDFDGMTCLKDVGKIKAYMKDIYGIHYSEETVDWENPDRIEKDAQQTMNVDRRYI